MKAAIVYASKKGFIKEAADRLNEKLDGNADLIDLFHQKTGDLSSYDVIILASSVRAGRYSGKFRKLCESQVSLLNDKKVVLLTGGLDEENYQETVEKNFSVDFRSLLWKIVYAGGRYNPDQFNRIMRSMMEKITKESGAIHKEKWENLETLARDIKAL